MTDVACFCGCCYSFDEGVGACPRCGEHAVVRPGAVAVSPEPAGGQEPAASPAPAPSAEGAEEQSRPAAEPLALGLARWLASAGSA